jgi:hypothetical protein
MQVTPESVPLGVLVAWLLLVPTGCPNASSIRAWTLPSSGCRGDVGGTEGAPSRPPSRLVASVAAALRRPIPAAPARWAAASPPVDAPAPTASPSSASACPPTLALALAAAAAAAATSTAAAAAAAAATAITAAAAAAAAAPCSPAALVRSGSIRLSPVLLVLVLLLPVNSAQHFLVLDLLEKAALEFTIAGR